MGVDPSGCDSWSLLSALDFAGVRFQAAEGVFGAVDGNDGAVRVTRAADTGGEIVAGLEGGTLDTSDNATVLEHFYDFDYPTGRATLILDEATRLCPEDCAL